MGDACLYVYSHNIQGMRDEKEFKPSKNSKGWFSVGHLHNVQSAAVAAVVVVVVVVVEEPEVAAEVVLEVVFF